MPTQSIYNRKKTFLVNQKTGFDMVSLPRRVFTFYRDGFRSLVGGRTLWKIIFIKLCIMFAFLKLFFFPNYLNTNFNSDAERADHVLDNITTITNQEH